MIRPDGATIDTSPLPARAMDSRPARIAAIVLLFAASLAHGSSPRNFTEVRQWVEQEFARDGRGGLTIGIVEQGELVWTHSIGWIDEAAKRPATRDSMMPWVNPKKDLLLPAAGLLTDVADLAKLMRFQMMYGPERVLSTKMLQASYQMLVPSNANLQYGDGVGFAAAREPDGKLAAAGHGGTWPEGFVTSYEFDGTAQVGVILLANTYAGQANYRVMVRRILALLDPASPGDSGLAELEQH